MDTGRPGRPGNFPCADRFRTQRFGLQYDRPARFPLLRQLVARGATSLWEDFQPEGGDVTSHNHHFWGDISSWFIQALAGIRFNPHRRSLLEADIRPSFVPQLDSAQRLPSRPGG